jgi:hypothetical protein
LRDAFLLAAALRIFYSLFGALTAPWLVLSETAIRSNDLTGNLMQRSQGLAYSFLGVWERFDTLWYIHIAQFGYDTPKSVVFYPLYPVLIRAVGAGISPLVAGLLVSFCASVFLFWGLHKLFSLDLGHTEVRMALLLCALWPPAFVFFVGDADSLVLALIVWTVYFARVDKWVCSCLTGFFAGLAKAVGVLVAVPLFVLAWRERKLRTLWSIPPILGFASYLLFLKVTGHLTPSEAYSMHWGSRMALPWETLSASFDQILHGQRYVALNLTILLAAFCLAFFTSHRNEYRLFALASLGFFLLKMSPSSQQQWARYALVFLVVFGNVVRLRIAGPVAAASAVLLALTNLVMLRSYLEWWLGV